MPDTLHFIENEAKFAIDASKLPRMPQPWLFIQGYEHVSKPQRGVPGNLTEMSVRIITTKQFYYRYKDLSVSGVREKMLVSALNLDEALSKLQRCSTVAIKMRHLFDHEGRLWYIDYFPQQDFWKSETEFETAEGMAAFRKNKKDWPEFVTSDTTGKEIGYTRHFAKPMSLETKALWGRIADYGFQKVKYSPPDAKD